MNFGYDNVAIATHFIPQTQFDGPKEDVVIKKVQEKKLVTEKEEKKSVLVGFKIKVYMFPPVPVIKNCSHFFLS